MKNLEVNFTHITALYTLEKRVNFVKFQILSTENKLNLMIKNVLDPITVFPFRVDLPRLNLSRD